MTLRQKLKFFIDNINSVINSSLDDDVEHHSRSAIIISTVFLIILDVISIKIILR